MTVGEEILEHVVDQIVKLRTSGLCDSLRVRRYGRYDCR